MTYLIEALIVGPVCYALGVLTVVRLWHRKLAREVAVQARGFKTWWDRWANVAVGLFMIVMALLIGNSQLQHNDDQHALQKQSSCLTTYANQLYDSLNPRQSANESLQRADEQFNDALVALLKVALSPNPDESVRRADALKLAAAAQHKQHVADMLSAERARNPYPPPPKKVCPK